jgi:tRNA (guanine-N(7)-)-methyltransferase
VSDGLAPNLAPKKLKESKHRILLRDGRELQYHQPFHKADVVPLLDRIPAEHRQARFEVEIGCGKGEFIARRAAAHPDRYFVGIDRRSDRVDLTQRKLNRVAETESGRNWIVLREDARCFLESALPPIQILHIYHPDPWPKSRHHKNRFFRSPDARKWAQAIVQGGQFRLSTDHRGYFEEIMDIVGTWDFLRLETLYVKAPDMGPPLSHFEGIFLRKQEPVYKALLTRL